MKPFGGSFFLSVIDYILNVIYNQQIFVFDYLPKSSFFDAD